MNTISENIIKASFHLSVWTIERFHDMSMYVARANELRKLDDGTLGKDIVNCLDKNDLNLVPGYESHDMKHVLLGYEMTPLDEIRMQAFMLGNGNISIPSVLIFLYGFILLPYKWNQFYEDFKLGLFSTPIKTWTIEEYADKSTTELKKQVINTKQKEEVMGQFATKMSITAMVAGGFGMIYCLPYLFSPVLEDLVGAGFPFVGGAILFASGLVSFSMRSRVKATVQPQYA